MAGTRNHTGTWDIKRRNTKEPPMLTLLQSLGWEHYEVHEPEPHILLFK